MECVSGGGTELVASRQVDEEVGGHVQQHQLTTVDFHGVQRVAIVEEMVTDEAAKEVDVHQHSGQAERNEAEHHRHRRIPLHPADGDPQRRNPEPYNRLHLPVIWRSLLIVGRFLDRNIDDQFGNYAQQSEYANEGQIEFQDPRLKRALNRLVKGPQVNC